MYVGRDFSPATINESLTYGLDFIDDLKPGEQLLNVVWTIGVTNGVDLNAMTHLQGPPVLFTTDGNAVPTATIQRIGGLQPGVTYFVSALVQTDLGNTIELHSHVTGVSIR